MTTPVMRHSLNIPTDIYTRLLTRCREEEESMTKTILKLICFGLDNLTIDLKRDEKVGDYEPPPPPDLSFEEQMRRAGLSEEEIARNLQEVEEVLRKEGIKE